MRKGNGGAIDSGGSGTTAGPAYGEPRNRQKASMAYNGELVLDPNPSCGVWKLGEN